MVHARRVQRGTRKLGNVLLVVLLVRACVSASSWVSSLQRGYSKQQSLHGVCYLLMHMWRHMAEGVQRESNATLPQKVLYDFGMDTLFKQECRGRMAQIMNAQPQQVVESLFISPLLYPSFG
jgi:hypothetical protein